MRRLLAFLFPACVIAIGMFWPIRDSIAQSPPMAKCENGVCTMSEADYRQLQSFHRRVREVSLEIDKQTTAMSNDIEQLASQLARCRSQIEARPS